MSLASLRHLRLFLAVVDLRSLTLAAEACGVTQPAVTQAMANLEARAGGALFQRSRHGAFATDRGVTLAHRVRRALGFLDPALTEVSPRLPLTVTRAQITALVAVREAENFTLAARSLGVGQPSVHRAVAQVEHEAGRPLFERTAYGLIPTRACRALAQAARLALAELGQAEADLAEMDGAEAGRIVIGALPLSRSAILPRALARFREARPRQPVSVIDGVYGELLAALRRGDIDVIVGALRDPAPIGDVVQERLFDDRLAFIAGRAHPMAGRTAIAVADLAREPWVVPRPGTPARAQFDGIFAAAGVAPPGQYSGKRVDLADARDAGRGAASGLYLGRAGRGRDPKGSRGASRCPGRSAGAAHRPEHAQRLGADGSTTPDAGSDPHRGAQGRGGVMPRFSDVAQGCGAG
ncbi:LysR family transcriptional regulator [Roseicyclus mahoneyensis]|uniref:DNA-binding transcriptional LysR family regulator n=1 Tax=Roseicyclus mahoneyensis TaxID=164332 RepID=A0A316GFH5_9RHOB|nr:LysR family transcriptional regulator [Roseicyclus mahoneyensis]PWK58130.1 DNA-binding transcriptional LysR family regulator [Roseicyclus mahoneyensis]